LVFRFADDTGGTTMEPQIARTLEQHMSDIAVATLRRLDHVAEELEPLRYQLLMLACVCHLAGEPDLAEALEDASLAAVADPVDRDLVVEAAQIAELAARISVQVP